MVLKNKNSLPCLAPDLKVCVWVGGGIPQLNQVWLTIMLIGIYLEILLHCNFYTQLCLSVSHSDYMVHTHICWSPTQLVSSTVESFYEK